MLYKEAVSKRIIELCTIYDYTPNRLAELSAVPPSTLRALIICTVDNPSSYVIFKICRTLKIEQQEFFNSSLFDEDNIDN